MIEFFVKETGRVVSTHYWYFVAGDGSVWRDNGRTCESQCGIVGFDDFADRCPHIGWRLTTPTPTA